MFSPAFWIISHATAIFWGQAAPPALSPASTSPAGPLGRGDLVSSRMEERILKRFDFKNVRLPAQEVISEVARMGGIAMPCHPGRPTIGLIEHYQTRPALEGVTGVEALNGGSKKGENERVADLITQYGYHAFGGSDSHLVSFVGLCATEFDRDIQTMEDLVETLRVGGYRPVDFRQPRPQTGTPV